MLPVDTRQRSDEHRSVLLGITSSGNGHPVE